MTRTPLSQRVLPGYTRGQEVANMVTHIIGACFGLYALICLTWFSARRGDRLSLVSGLIYAAVMIALYVISSVYHGLTPSTGKKVMQILDHCSIYCLIAGTYTPIALVGVRPMYPAVGWALFLAEWLIAAMCIVFSAIDLKKFRVLEMVSYIVMGWLVIFFLKPVRNAIGPANFYWILAGGVVYTLGSILYGIGKKNKNFHTIFHVFCLAGSALQAISVIRICAGHL
jgi:hemolysin III